MDKKMGFGIVIFGLFVALAIYIESIIYASGEDCNSRFGEYIFNTTGLNATCVYEYIHGLCNCYFHPSDWRGLIYDSKTVKLNNKRSFRWCNARSDSLDGKMVEIEAEKMKIESVIVISLMVTSLVGVLTWITLDYLRNRGSVK